MLNRFVLLSLVFRIPSVTQRHRKRRDAEAGNAKKELRQPFRSSRSPEPMQRNFESF